jgi:hypothetical protein
MVREADHQVNTCHQVITGSSACADDDDAEAFQLAAATASALHFDSRSTVQTWMW